MTKKIRLTRIMVKEYEPMTEYYPEGATIEEMATLDMESDDRELLFEDCTEDTVTYEIVEKTEEGIEPPYLVTREVKVKTRYQYNPNYGDNRICECGDEYERHFDSYENMAPVGCKYCGCRDFKEKK